MGKRREDFITVGRKKAAIRIAVAAMMEWPKCRTKPALNAQNKTRPIPWLKKLVDTLQVRVFDHEDQ